MLEASDGIGRHLGGVVDRRAVADRLAARAEPLPPLGRPGRPTANGRTELVPFSAVRRRTAEHLRHSLDVAAHALVVDEVDFTAVDRTRRTAGLSYLPFVARAVVEATREFPHVNATIGDDGLLVSADVNLGIAVDLAHDGLVVPVVHGADGLRLLATAERIDDVAGRARDGRLIPADVEGATFTITNLGSQGTLVSAPILNHPQVAILSTDGVRMRPVALPGPDGDWRIAVRPVGNLSLSFDHRAFDGAYAAGFLGRVRHLLEHRDWEAER